MGNEKEHARGLEAATAHAFLGEISGHADVLYERVRVTDALEGFGMSKDLRMLLNTVE